MQKLIVFADSELRWGASVWVHRGCHRRCDVGLQPKFPGPEPDAMYVGHHGRNFAFLDGFGLGKVMGKWCFFLGIFFISGSFLKNRHVTWWILVVKIFFKGYWYVVKGRLKDSCFKTRFVLLTCYFSLSHGMKLGFAILSGYYSKDISYHIPIIFAMIFPVTPPFFLD